MIDYGSSMYPTKLNKIIKLFESLPEDERRETLVSYADNAKKQEPRAGENFELVDVRKDEECTDMVGVYLHVDENGRAHIRMTLGPEVQTLTRSMAAILCKGLEGSTPQEILDLPSDFVTRIVGTELGSHNFRCVNFSASARSLASLGMTACEFSRDDRVISFTVRAGADAAK